MPATILLHPIFLLFTCLSFPFPSPSDACHAGYVFKQLIKSCVHSLEINYIFERKQLDFTCVISVSFKFVPGIEQRLLGFLLHFQRKKWPLTPAIKIKYFGTAVTAQCPRHIFGNNFHDPIDFRFLLSYYNSCIFLIATNKNYPNKSRCNASPDWLILQWFE